jgi:hypothetical protein
MQTKISNITTSDSPGENQTIDGVVSELERHIENSIHGSGARLAQTLSAKRLVHFGAFGKRVGNSNGNTAEPAEKVHGFLSILNVHHMRAVEIPVPAITRFFDEINLAGEMVGFGVGIIVRLTILSTATFLVVGFFSVFVFLFAVGRGLMKKHWDTSPR